MPIRVVVAEDSPTARALLVSILEADPALHIVGQATNGHEAVALAKRLHPDVMTVDIHMPGMGGFDAIRRIMNEAPTPIVVVSASVSAQDVAASLAALNAGALTALSKPAGPHAPDFEESARQLVATVKGMSEVKVVRRWAVPRAAPSSTIPPAMPAAEVPPSAPGALPLSSLTLGSSALSSSALSSSALSSVSQAPLSQSPLGQPSLGQASLAPPPTHPARLLAIAASTGGPAALYQLLARLPAELPVPVAVVQHISHGFLPGLIDWWQMASRLPIRIAASGDVLVPGTVYVAPDAGHLELAPRNVAMISRASPVDGHRPSASVLFRSAARAYGASVVALILTGMGRDGVEGLREVHARGGHIIAQDRDSSVVFGMPGAAIEAGVVNEVLPLNDMAAHLNTLIVPPSPRVSR